MGIEYLGLSNINGPLVVLEGVQEAFFDEIVEDDEVVSGSVHFGEAHREITFL